MEKERLIFHVDVNSAFLSWESARRVREGKSDLRNIPAVVGGDPAKRTGVVLAKSIPAKKLGIHTGEPMAMALRKCPTLVSVPSDFTLYDQSSRAFKAICRSYAPVMESFSIDEVFLDMSGTRFIYPDPIATAHEIKAKIQEELGFTVNIGIGPNKVLAKMASDFEKPDKVHTLFPDEIPDKMWPLPVSDLLFLGKKSAEKLNYAGIYTIGQMAHRSEHEIQSILGLKAGHQLWNYANGVDDSPVKDTPDEPKGYSVETTFEENITTMERALPILLGHVDVVAARMRRDGKKCTCVSVVFKTSEFKSKSHQCKVEGSTDVTDEIYLLVKKLFEECWKGEPLRLIGVALTGITDEDYEQISFFKKPVDRTKNKKLDHAIDEIRKKYGNDMVSRASTLGKTGKISRKAQAQMENERLGK